MAMDACCPELNPGMRLMTSKEQKDIVEAQAKDLRKQAQALMTQSYQLKETTRPPPVIVAAGNELIGVLTLLNRPELQPQTSWPKRQQRQRSTGPMEEEFWAPFLLKRDWATTASPAHLRSSSSSSR